MVRIDVTRLSVEQARRFRDAEDTVVVDTRPAPEFCAGHPQGALSVPFSLKGLAERVLLVAPDTRRVVVVENDNARAEAVRWQLESAGIELLGGIAPDEDAWSVVNEWETIDEWSVDDVAGSKNCLLVDVREPIEWDMGVIDGAELISLRDVPIRAEYLSAKSDKPIVAICEGGVRSATAASLLKRRGIKDVAHVPSGMAGYRQTGKQLEFPAVEETK